MRIIITAPGIVRIAVGDHPPRAASSYHSHRPHPAAATSVARLDVCSIVAAHEASSSCSPLPPAAPCCDLDFATIALTPLFHPRFEFLGEQVVIIAFAKSV